MSRKTSTESPQILYSRHSCLLTVPKKDVALCLYLVVVLVCHVLMLWIVQGEGRLGLGDLVACEVRGCCIWL